MAHWLALEGRRFVLHTALIAFHHTIGHHTGFALAAIIIKILDAFGITTKVSYFPSRYYLLTSV